MKFINGYDINKVVPADYNPRKIKKEAFEKLKESLQRFGVCKAIIANQDGTIVAGHQRTRAIKEVGIEKVPIFILDKRCSVKDEIRFNLIHNSVETNSAVVKIQGIADVPFGYSEVTPDRIEIKKRGNGVINKEISRLLVKYGSFGSVIVNEDGYVVHNSDYALCSKLMAENLVVFKMGNEQADDFLKYMKINYGSYSFEALNIKPYVQTHCQMNRSEDKHSTLYENVIKPSIKKQDRILDFGAGKMYYVEQLKKLGYKILGYEPFYKIEHSYLKLNLSAVIRFINDIKDDVSKNGLYDVVVLDSVINSITSNDYQDWVLTSCNSLLKKDGIFYAATRNKNFIMKKHDFSKTQRKDIEFLDEDDFAATFRYGSFTLQKFHTKQSFEKLLLNYFEVVNVMEKTNSQLWAICKKPISMGIKRYKKALDIEFNLEYPGGVRHNKHEELVKAILHCH